MIFSWLPVTWKPLPTLAVTALSGLQETRGDDTRRLYLYADTMLHLLITFILGLDPATIK